MATATTTRKTAATKRSTGARKAAGTRARTSARTTASRKAAPKVETVRTPVEVVGEYAERAVLIPVGAALIARDRLVSGVNDVIESYSTPTKTQAQLKKFERRGTTARKSLQRDVRKTRTRVERELRLRRRELEKTLTRVDRRRTRAAKDISKQADLATARFENAVQTGIKEGSELAKTVQERVL